MTENFQQQSRYEVRVLLNGHFTHITCLGSPWANRADADRDPWTPAEKLLLCPKCDCPFVETELTRAMVTKFELEFSCPNCSWSGSAEMSSTIKLYLQKEKQLNRRQMQRLDQAARLAEIDRFTEALAKDLIGPDDFDGQRS